MYESIDFSGHELREFNYPLSNNIIGCLILHTLIFESKLKLTEEFFVLELVDVGAPGVGHGEESFIEFFTAQFVIGFWDLGCLLLLVLLCVAARFVTILVTFRLVH